MANAPTFRHAADGGLVVEFGETIDPEINGQVLALDASLADDPLAGVIETVPTYRSLLVFYDPLQVRARTLIERIEARLPIERATAGERRRWTVPVHYGGEAALDLDAVARAHEMTTDEVIRIHSGAAYTVFMIGFMPGYTYLGGLPEALHTSRRETPRQKTPAGGVAIGGIQTAISSLAVPSGWNFIGRTPLRLFDPVRDPAFLFRAGDLIRMTPIDADELERLDDAVARGEIPAACETAS